MNEVERKKKNVLVSSSKQIALMSVTVALLIAGQLVVSAVQGVEIVTVLLLSFCVRFGVRRGLIVATAFSLIRCFLFGFVPNVVVLYLVYYNLFAIVFGLMGIVARKIPVPLAILVLCAVVGVITVGFTLLDDIITPWMLDYTEKSARAYFIASLPAMAVQTVCAVVTVALLWYPLNKIFSMIRI